MNRRWGRAELIVLLGLLTQACCMACAAAPDCVEARRVTREAMALMATTARDESTKLRGLVRDGWQTPYDDLTIIRSVDVGECHPMGQSVKVVVLFDVLGRLVAAGQGDRVAFEAGPRLDRRELHLVDVGGALKIDDLRSLEPHVEPEYAIRILTEVANSEPQVKAKCLALIAELRRVAGSAPDGGPNR